MNQKLIQLIQKIFQKFGFELHKTNPGDFSEMEKGIINQVKPFTLTSTARIASLIKSVEYVIENNIPGAIVECGVWKGGSMMAAIKTAQKLKSNNREFYLYDTFEGMTKPTSSDVSLDDKKALTKFTQESISEQSSKWANIEIEQVRKNILNLGYDKNKIYFVKGLVEESIPKTIPEKIAILRLDTDWYESTKHELIHLFPRLVKGGVIIIDDYGYWKGCKKAVDEYIIENKISLLLNRIDNTGRIAIKL